MSNKIIVQKRQFDQNLKEEWNKLWSLSKNAHFFNSSDWFEFARKEFSHDSYVVTVSKFDELIAVMPICMESWFGVIAQTSPGGRFMDKSSLLTKDDNQDVQKVLVEYLMSKGNFYLPEIPEYDMALILRLFPEVKARFSDINYFLPLDKSPWEHLSKKNFSKIKNRIKKNQRDLSYKSFKGNEEALRAAFAIDAHSYKNEKGMATFNSSENRRMFLHICRNFPQQMSIDIIYFRNQPIAYSIGFTFKKVYTAIHTSFDNAFQTLTPGKLLAYMLIERLTNQGFTELDFGRGDSRMKKDFTASYRNQYLVYYHANPFARLWWQTANDAYTGIQENELMYSAYRYVKKIWYH